MTEGETLVTKDHEGPGIIRDEFDKSIKDLEEGKAYDLIHCLVNYWNQ